MNNNLQIANTIKQQIMSGNFWALGSWGARQYVALSADKTQRGGLMFKIKTPRIKQGGKVIVRLTHDDLYTVEVGTIRKYEWKKLDEMTGVYAEMLVQIIDGMIENK